jgi:hypothetical protein
VPVKLGGRCSTGGRLDAATDKDPRRSIRRRCDTHNRRSVESFAVGLMSLRLASDTRDAPTPRSEPDARAEKLAECFC